MKIGRTLKTALFSILNVICFQSCGPTVALPKSANPQTAVSDILPLGTPTPTSTTSSSTSPTHLYAQWKNGPSNAPDFFPIAVWLQNPISTGHSGPYANLAAAAAGEKMNIFLGLLGDGAVPTWPEHFGQDNGELAAIKANNLYVVGGANTPDNENTSNDSVASVLALAQSLGAEANVIGYNAGDEPHCGSTMEQVPSVISGISSYDPTRPVLYNHTAWMNAPEYLSSSCLNASTTALQATSVASFDLYPLTNPWMASPDSDFKSISGDHLYLQGETIRAMAELARPNEPLWAYIESGSDNFGLSEAANSFQGGVSNGSNILVNASGLSVFTSTWIGLTVSGSGIPANTTITSIIDSTHAVISSSVSGVGCIPGQITASLVQGSANITYVSGCANFASPGLAWRGISGPGVPSGTVLYTSSDPLHASMSMAATATGTFQIVTTDTQLSESVTVTGGAFNSDCVASANLCVVNGNEFRPTPEQVNAEVWMSLINGANGIEYFCHDSSSYSYCLGDTAGGSGATATQNNLTYINKTVLGFAPQLNSPTVGMCSMQLFDAATGIGSIASSCTNGILSMTTDNTAVPGMALAKNYNGMTYLFVQSDRRSPNGATFTLSLSGQAGKTATVIYDSNAQYDPAHSSIGAKFKLDSSASFADSLGAFKHDYQVKIYSVQ